MAVYDYIDLSGTVIPDTTTTKSEVENEIRLALGNPDVDLSDGSPGGVIVNAEVISRTGIAENNSKLANQINPNHAGGPFLDAIMALSYAITGGRRLASPSTFSVAPDLTGAPGTLIPAGSIATTVAGDEFVSTADVTLDAAGQGSVAFVSVENGPIPAPAGDLNTVGQGAPVGWETITNTVSATLGLTQQSDNSLRNHRRDVLALQGTGTPEAIFAAVSALPGVRSMSFRENTLPVEDVVDGITMKSQSIYVCVDGGIDYDIAFAIASKKFSGARTNGSVATTITDPTSGQELTTPIYFDRPAQVQVYIRVTIAPTSVSNPSSVIEAAVMDYVNGNIDGERGFVIGASASPFEIASAINLSTPDIFIKNVGLSTDGSTFVATEVPIAINQIATTTENLIFTVVS